MQAQASIKATGLDAVPAKAQAIPIPFPGQEQVPAGTETAAVPITAPHEAQTPASKQRNMTRPVPVERPAPSMNQQAGASIAPLKQRNMTRPPLPAEAPAPTMTAAPIAQTAAPSKQWNMTRPTLPAKAPVPTMTGAPIHLPIEASALVLLE